MNDECLENFVRQLLGTLPMAVVSRGLSALESHPVLTYSESDRRRGGQFGAKLKKLQPYGHRLHCGPVYRQAFLWGTANYLDGLPHEELVVGFGLAHGTRTRVDSVLKIRGGARRVSLPRDTRVAIHSFLNEDERHTAILVHNHPDTLVAALLGLVLGSDPLPSLADRAVGAATLLERFQSTIDGSAFGRVRFYLAQNDAISEFSGLTPAILLDLLTTGLTAA
jgi:hypothetical protein